MRLVQAIDGDLHLGRRGGRDLRLLARLRAAFPNAAGASPPTGRTARKVVSGAIRLTLHAAIQGIPGTYLTLHAAIQGIRRDF